MDFYELTYVLGAFPRPVDVLGWLHAFCNTLYYYAVFDPLLMTCEAAQWIY